MPNAPIHKLSELFPKGFTGRLSFHYSGAVLDADACVTGDEWEDWEITIPHAGTTEERFREEMLIAAGRVALDIIGAVWDRWCTTDGLAFALASSGMITRWASGPWGERSISLPPDAADMARGYIQALWDANAKIRTDMAHVALERWERDFRESCRDDDGATLADDRREIAHARGLA